MSESANCEEQREEQTELEEAGGAEVRWFIMGIVSSPRTDLFHRDVAQVSIYETPVPYVRILVPRLPVR